MGKVLVDLVTLPFKFAFALVELLGRTLAIVVGLALFGLGALMCIIPPFIIIGAPLCLFSGLLVVKAF